eukprot:324660-Prymnesium_polylepis.1
MAPLVRAIVRALDVSGWWRRAQRVPPCLEGLTLSRTPWTFGDGVGPRIHRCVTLTAIRMFPVEGTLRSGRAGGAH